MRRIFGSHQALAQIAGVEIRGMFQRLIPERLRQNTGPHVQHQIRLEYLAHQTRPFRAEGIRINPQHFRRGIS